MNPIEITAALLGVVNVTLVVRRSVWNYPFGIAMVMLYAKVFYDDRLYSDALLQIFFFVVQFYGWWAWSRAKAAAGEVRVELLSWRARIGLLALIAGAIAGWGMLMRTYTDAAAPWWDAAIAMMSIVAQILMSRRYLENWVLWIAVDILAIGLFSVRGLHVTAALYVVFLGLAIWGLEEWMAVRRRAARAAAAA